MVMSRPLQIPPWQKQKCAALVMRTMSGQSRPEDPISDGDHSVIVSIRLCESRGGGCKSPWSPQFHLWRTWQRRRASGPQNRFIRCKSGVRLHRARGRKQSASLGDWRQPERYRLARPKLIRPKRRKRRTSLVVTQDRRKSDWRYGFIRPRSSKSWSIRL